MPGPGLEIQKIEKSLDKLSSMITEMLSRTAVIESKLQKMDYEEKEINKSIDDVRVLINELENKLTAMFELNRFLTDSLKYTKERIESSFVSKDQFEPVKRIVYAISGSMILGVIGALLNLALRKV